MSRPRARRIRGWIAALAVLSGVLAGCGGSSKPASTPTSSPSSSPRTSLPAINPLTGLNASDNKVIAVKIDDTAGARPQVGLNDADIVYIEQVEGGLTRLVAVFNSTLPSRVGPVRSTRNDDPEIVGQYGPIIYVASGGDHIEYRPMDRSNLHTVINDRGGPGFSRDNSRPVPLNLFVNLTTVAKKVKGPTASSIGLHWSTKITNPARTGTLISTRVGGTPVEFRWSKGLHRYLRYYQGHVDQLADRHAVNTPNVIVQFVHGHPFPADIDPAGNPAFYQHTVGTGKVAVFRNGQRIDGTWSRPRAAEGTRLTDSRGKPITLAPGGAWFVLVNAGTPLAG